LAGELREEAMMRALRQLNRVTRLPVVLLVPA